MIRYDPNPPQAELASTPAAEPGLRRHVYSDHERILRGDPERDELAAAEKREKRRESDARRVARRRSPPALEDPEPEPDVEPEETE